MHLIAPLASGVAGAESGTATIVKLLTGTGATYYTDFEGQNSGSGTINLDSNGGYVAYVDTLVTVTVYDSSGDQVRQFTAGAKDSGVEINSQSFTGTSYDDGSGTTTSAASQPTTLKAQADLWLTQNFGIDWKVALTSEGTQKTLPVWLAEFSGLFYNVKSTAYGALGDAATDDTSAIQAAIDAASAAGGGIVFFPYGTYIITSALTLATDVQLWGTGGANSSIIMIDHASNAAVDGSAGISGVGIQDLSFYANQSNTGDLLTLNGGQIYIARCNFGDGTNVLGNHIVAQGVDINIIHCFFTVSTTTASPAISGDGTEHIRVTNCEFYMGANAASIGQIVDSFSLQMTGCRFRNTGISSGTVSCVRVDGDSTITNNIFTDGSGGTETITAIETTLSTGIMVESGNQFGATAVIPYDIDNSGDEQLVILGSRTHGISSQTITGAGTTTLDADQFQAHHLHHTTGGTTQTIDASTEVPLAHDLTIHYWNDTVSTVTITWGTSFNGNGSPTVSANKIKVFRFHAGVDAGGVTQWQEVGTPVEVSE